MTTNQNLNQNSQQNNNGNKIDENSKTGKSDPASESDENSKDSFKNKYSKFQLKKEQEEFQQRLIEFHRHKNVNTPILSWPTFNGKYIDLHKLYNKVISLGGWERVCEKEKWNEVCMDLDCGLFGACSNGAQALKLIYIRYLSLYEKVHLSNSATALSNVISASATSFANSNSVASLNILLDSLTNNSLLHSNSISTNQLMSTAGLDDKDEESLLNGRRKFSYLLESIPMTYNYNQHIFGSSNSSLPGGIAQPISANSASLPNGITPSANVKSSAIQYNPYEKIQTALESGLPNEVDFTFNTLLLLSSDEIHAFRIYSCPRLIDLMLAHIGFFGTNDKYNYRSLYDSIWYNNMNQIKFDNELDLYEEKDDDQDEQIYTRLRWKRKPRNFVKFWYNSIQVPYDELSTENFTLSTMIQEILPKMYNDYLKTLPPQELLSLRETYEDTEIEFRRIEQVMVILNNLSFEENNADFMANKSSCLLEFLIMCLYCTNSHIDLHKHALDILANLSRKIKLKTMNDKLKSLLILSIAHLIGYEAKEEKDEFGHYISPSSISLDRLDTIRGLEIFTKLFAQHIGINDSDDYENERIISRYIMNKDLFLEQMLLRIEHLLSIRDVLILMHSLECLYSMTLYSEAISNMVVNYNSSSSKIVSILVNFLTVDMSHFGVEIDNNNPSGGKSTASQTGPVNIYKVIPQNYVHIPNQNNPSNQVIHQSSPHISSNKPASLLQQTLSNQHTQNKNIVINTSLPQQGATNQAIVKKGSVSPTDQQSKNILCNWLITCFQADPTSELSKTQLYPYYQQIAKMNNWSIVSINTFFEILTATFPSLKFDDNANKIHGLKLVLNLKQQIQLRQKMLAQPGVITQESTTKQAISPTETSAAKTITNPPEEKDEKSKTNEQDKEEEKVKAEVNNKRKLSDSSEEKKDKNSETDEDSTSDDDSKSEGSVKKVKSEDKPKDDKAESASSNNSAVSQSEQQSKPAENTANYEYLCEWDGCNRYFKSAKSVYNHVCRFHLGLCNDQSNPTESQRDSIDSKGTICKWPNCDQIKRQKWSLVNHLQEKHCNENAMRQAIFNRQRGIYVASAAPPNNTSLNQVKDAAYFAIQRHQRIRREDFASSEEGPITKSLRLLSALILRNLARNSEKAKNSIRVHESILTNIGFDLMESSNAIANCLWHLNH